MIDYRTLSQKPEIQVPGMEEKLPDLFCQTYIGNMAAGNCIEVTDAYIARPDLISLAVYGDDKYTDIVCKYNGIQNPFELNEGMILFLPDLSDIAGMYNQQPPVSQLADKEMKILNQSVGFHKRLDERRSPNQIVEGETNYIIDRKNRIIVY